MGSCIWASTDARESSENRPHSIATKFTRAGLQDTIMIYVSIFYSYTTFPRLQNVLVHKVMSVVRALKTEREVAEDAVQVEETALGKHGVSMSFIQSKRSLIYLQEDRRTGSRPPAESRRKRHRRHHRRCRAGRRRYREDQ